MFVLHIGTLLFAGFVALAVAWDASKLRLDWRDIAINSALAVGSVCAIASGLSGLFR